MPRGLASGFCLGVLPRGFAPGFCLGVSRQGTIGNWLDGLWLELLALTIAGSTLIEHLVLSDIVQQQVVRFWPRQGLTDEIRKILSGVCVERICTPATTSKFRGV